MSGTGRRRVTIRRPAIGEDAYLSLWRIGLDAADAYRDVRKDLDPIAERNKRRSGSITFKEAAVAFHKQNVESWSAKYAAHWLPPSTPPTTSQIAENKIDVAIRQWAKGLPSASPTLRLQAERRLPPMTTIGVPSTTVHER